MRGKIRRARALVVVPPAIVLLSFVLLLKAGVDGLSTLLVVAGLLVAGAVIESRW